MALRLFIYLAALLFMAQPCVHAQSALLTKQRAIVAQKQAAENCSGDTSYINALNDLAASYYFICADSLFLYAGKALDCAKKARYGRGESIALRILGNGYRLLADYSNMLSYYLQALSVAEKINDYDLIGKVCINLAYQHLDMRDADGAVAMIGRARHYLEQTRDSASLVKSLIGIGEAWFIRLKLDSALKYFRQAAQLSAAMRREDLLFDSNEEIASVLSGKDGLREALAIYLHSLDYHTRKGDKMRSSWVAIDIALIYLRLKQYRNALKYGQLTLRMTTALKARVETRGAYHIIADAYEALGDYQSALPYRKRYADLSDSVFNDQIRHSTARLEAKFEYETKEARLREEQKKKDVLNASIVQTRQLQIWLTGTLIVLLSLLSHLLCRSRTSKQRSNRELMALHDKIIRQKEEMERQSSRLLVNNQQKDKLFSIISHDLKMPLLSLHTMLDLLKTNALPEAEIAQMMEMLGREVDYSSELIRNLLLWSNSQLNGILARPAVLDLQPLADEVLAQFKNQAAQKEIMLINQLAPDLQGYADKDMLHAVIRNLVSNAIKFCSAGDTITLEGKPVAGGVELCIGDTGKGITEEILDKINRRQTVTTFGTAGEKGTGLGLLLCRDFIELNKGGFHVESIYGKGSQFYIALQGPHA